MNTPDKELLHEYSTMLDKSGEHFTYSVLSVFLNYDDTMSKKEREFIENHLKECPLCMSMFNEVRDVEGFEVENKHSIFRLPHNIFKYSIAAVLVITAGLTLLYVLQRTLPPPSISEIQITGQDFASLPIDQSRFVPNPVLENFIERTVRSKKQSSFISPEIGDTVSVPLKFTWRKVGITELFLLRIVDNNDTEVWGGESTESEQIVYKTIPPGLYYSKLYGDGMLVDVGKFFVL